MVAAKGGPRIDTILATSGPRVGEPIEQARSGDVVRIVGSGFGNDPRAVRVHFGEVEARPFTVPFSGEELAVACPPVEAPTETVRVAVDDAASESYRFRVEPFETEESDEGPPGAATREFVERVDEYAALTEALARAVAEIEDEDGPVRGNGRRALHAGADHLAGMRRVLRRTHEVLGQWSDLQAEIEFAPIRTIEMYDDLITRGGFTRSVEILIEETYGSSGIFAQATDAPGGITHALVQGPGPAAESLSSTDSVDWSAWGFGLHEGAKALEGIENGLKVVATSASAGAVVEADVEINWGEAVSAVAKAVDFVAQLFQKWGKEGQPSIGEVIEVVEEIKQGVQQLEEKTDRIESRLEQVERRIELFKELVVDKFERTWSAFDVIGEVLGLTLVGEPWVFDPTTTTTGPKIPDRDVKKELHDIEGKTDRLEEKADRQEEKLDRQEEKLDRIEEKEDRKEEKIDRIGLPFLPAEGSVANQRGGADRVTSAVAAIRAQGNEVHLRAAIDVDRDELDQESAWSDWEPFGRPSPSAVLREVSLDLQYEEGSDEQINGLLSVRDQVGRIFHRSFEGIDHDELLDPDEWSEWEEFLEQP